MLYLLLAVTLIFSTSVVQAEDLLPTPEASTIIELDIPDTLGWAMRAPSGLEGHYFGFAITCKTTSPGHAEATVFFGSFPRDGRPMQLAIRTPANTVERFGSVFTAPGPEYGFHSPKFTEPEEVWRFANAALVPGSLVSNGFHSFRNRADKTENRNVWKAFRACLREYSNLPY